MAMNQPPAARLVKMLSKMPVSISIRFTEKSSSRPGRTRRTARSCCTSSSSKAAMSTPGLALMAIWALSSARES